MAYMNLLIRYRADLDDTREAVRRRRERSRRWVQKTLETTKMKAEQKESGRIRTAK